MLYNKQLLNDVGHNESKVFNSKCAYSIQNAVFSQIAHLAGGSFQFNSKTGCKKLKKKKTKEKKTKYVFAFCILKGLCKDFLLHNSSSIGEQEYLLPNSTAFMFTCCFAFW